MHRFSFIVLVKEVEVLQGVCLEHLVVLDHWLVEALVVGHLWLWVMLAILSLVLKDLNLLKNCLCYLWTFALEVLKALKKAKVGAHH